MAKLTRTGTVFFLGLALLAGGPSRAFEGGGSGITSAVQAVTAPAGARAQAILLQRQGGGSAQAGIGQYSATVAGQLPITGGVGTLTLPGPGGGGGGSYSGPSDTVPPGGSGGGGGGGSSVVVTTGDCSSCEVTKYPAHYLNLQWNEAPVCFSHYDAYVAEITVQDIKNACAAGWGGCGTICIPNNCGVVSLYVHDYFAAGPADCFCDTGGPSCIHIEVCCSQFPGLYTLAADKVALVVLFNCGGCCSNPCGDPSQALEAEPDRSIVSVSQGGVQEIEVEFSVALGRAPAARAGDVRFLVLGSASGTTPGLLLDGGFAVPLVPDSYFAYTLKHVNPVELIATVDAQAAPSRATARIAVPAGTDAALAGRVLHHVVVSFQGGRFLAASGPVPLRLVP